MTKRQYTQWLKRWAVPCASLVHALAEWTDGKNPLDLDAVIEDADALRDALDWLERYLDADCPF